MTCRVTLRFAAAVTDPRTWINVISAFTATGDDEMTLCDCVRRADLTHGLEPSQH